MRWLAEWVVVVWRAVDGERFWAELVKGTGSEARAWLVLGVLVWMLMGVWLAWLKEKAGKGLERGAAPRPGTTGAEDAVLEDFFVRPAGRVLDLAELRKRLGEAFPGRWADGTEPRDLGLLLEGVTEEELEGFVAWMKAGELEFGRAHEWMARKAGVERG